MAQPTWTTPAGTIGSVLENSPLAFQFIAVPSSVGNTLVYTKLNGDFPQSTSLSTTFTLSSSGILSGTPGEVAENTTSFFTVRVTEYAGSLVVGINDRTFSLTIEGSTSPYFLTPAGALYPGPTFLPDTTWDPYQILYVSTDPNTTTLIRIVDGELPPGLEITQTGIIRGYATPPVDQDLNPINVTYNFTLQLSSESGESIRNFSITVINQETLPGYSGRAPAIFNIDYPAGDQTNNVYYSYFIYNSAGNIGTYYQDNNFVFKIIGNDWAKQPLTYTFTGALPPGLSYDPVNGWITGTITEIPSLINVYNFSVYVTNPLTILSSPSYNFTITTVGLVNGIPVDTSISWVSEQNLGTINNGAISQFNVVANAPIIPVLQSITRDPVALEYTVVSGALPAGLELLPNGEIIGRVAFESRPFIIPQGSTEDYEFTVKVSVPEYPIINSEKTFNISVYQKFDTPYENIYIKAYVDLQDKWIVRSLVHDFNIIPFEYLYRQFDPYFGKASGWPTTVVYQHAYGIPASELQTYINALNLNHYRRQLVLGQIETAIARNDNNEIIYEVVYCKIIDDLVNKQGESISKTISWPRKINGSSAPLYPASLENMRQQVYDYIPGQITDSSILPQWMTTQQKNGSTLGFVKAWVICYTKPGYSEIIKSNIETQWPEKLNQMDFKVDRLEVDKSYTSDYKCGSWDSLPSGSNYTDEEDKQVFFPRKTIISPTPPPVPIPCP